MEDVFVALIEAEERKGRPHELPAHCAPSASRNCTTSCATRAAWRMALAVPVMMLLLFGYALSLDVDRIPTLVYDQDRTAASRDLVRALQRARASSRSRGMVGSYAPIERRHRPRPRPDGRGDPARLRRRPRGAGREAPVQLLLDGSDSNTASIALGYAESLVRGYSLAAAQPRR